MPSRKVPERMLWAVETMAPRPDDHLLEIGCGPGIAVSLVCERLVGGRIVAIDRSATAIGRAEERNAGHVAAGKAVLLTVALEDLEPSSVLQGREGFDKIFAMNVNLFWTRPPVKELDLVRSLLMPDGTLYLFYGYGRANRSWTAGERDTRILGILADHLTAGGFTTELRRGASTVCVVAAPK